MRRGDDLLGGVSRRFARLFYPPLQSHGIISGDCFDKEKEVRSINAMSIQSLNRTPDALLTHIDKMMVELIALRQAVEEMVTARTPITQQADQTLAVQIADDYLAMQVSPNQAMHQRVEQIVLETIREARANRTVMQANPATVITGHELRRRLGLPNA